MFSESGLVRRAPMEDTSSYIDQTMVFLHDSTSLISENHPNIHKPLLVSFHRMQVSVIYPYVVDLRTHLRNPAKVHSITNSHME